MGKNNDSLKLTPKQEKFAKSFVETGNASEAYRLNYNVENMSDAAVWVEASRTLSIPKVSLRVSELQRGHAAKHTVTVDTLTAELNAAVEMAIDTGNVNGLVSAVREKATIHGRRSNVADAQIHIHLPGKAALL